MSPSVPVGAFPDSKAKPHHPGLRISLGQRSKIEDPRRVPLDSIPGLKTFGHKEAHIPLHHFS